MKAVGSRELGEAHQDVGMVKRAGVDRGGGEGIGIYCEEIKKKSK